MVRYVVTTLHLSFSQQVRPGTGGNSGEPSARGKTVPPHQNVRLRTYNTIVHEHLMEIFGSNVISEELYRLQLEILAVSFDLCDIGMGVRQCYFPTIFMTRYPHFQILKIWRHPFVGMFMISPGAISRYIFLIAMVKYEIATGDMQQYF